MSGRMHLKIRKRNGKKKKKRLHKVTLKSVLKAIKDSTGSIRITAKRLNRPYGSIYTFIKRNPDAQEALRVERERVADIAEETITEMMVQRLDFGTASRTARWLLERKHVDRGYRPSREVTVQGGKNPLKVQNEELISLDKLKSIPLDVRKQMLAEIEKGEEKEE